MQSPLSINVKPWSVKDWPSCLKFLKQLNPSVVVVAVDQMDHFNRVLETQDALPTTKIIARFIDEEHDGSLHLKPQASGDNRKYIVSPVDFLNTYGVFGKNGRSLYYFNEPSGEVNGDDITRLVSHCIETMDLAATPERDISLTILNWSVGHPLLTADGLELDKRLDPILFKLNQHRERHLYGLHLYAPADLQGRLNALKRTCDRLKISLPRIVVTEFGFDKSANDGKNGFKTRGYDGQSFAEWQVAQLRNIYKPWVESGDLLGLTTFIYGDDASWKNFNVETGNAGEVSTAWRDAILNAKQMGLLDMQPEAPTLPVYKKDIVFGQTYQLNMPGKIITAYIAPSNGDRRIGTIPDRAEVVVLDILPINGEKWLKVKYKAFSVDVFIQGDLVGLRQTVTVPVVTIPPEVPPIEPQSPQTNGTEPKANPLPETPETGLKTRNSAIVAQLKIMRGAIDALITLLDVQEPIKV